MEDLLVLKDVEKVGEEKRICAENTEVLEEQDFL